MTIQVRASAPAKVILLGEHFVVHDGPAIVLAIDRRATVTAKLRTDRKIWIHSEAMKTSGYFMKDRFHAEEDKDKAEEKLKPVYTIAQSFLSRSKRDTGLNIEISSKIPVASGLGSSAAMAVASAAALNRLLETELALDDIFKVALEAEKIIHRTPSGVDPAVSIYRGIINYYKGDNIRRLDITLDLPLIIIGDTGKERSTGNMVAHVNDLKRRYPFIIDNIIRAGEGSWQEASKPWKRTSKPWVKC